MTQLRRTLDRLNRSKADSEKGFSLIELIIVIVILGILVAIAIPIYNHIQDTARQNAVATAASNGASEATSQLADNPDVTKVSLANLNTSDITVTLSANTSDTDNVCVTATDKSGNTAAAGPTSVGGKTCP